MTTQKGCFLERQPEWVAAGHGGLTMAKYRKKVPIDAVQWWPDGHPQKPVDALPESEIPSVTRWEEKPAYGWIETLEGGHVVTPGDWIATGVEGEHWPIKPDIFDQTYEPVEEGAHV